MKKTVTTLLIMFFTIGTVFAESAGFSSGFEALEHNRDRANSYDNNWQTQWVANVETILSTPINGVEKTNGKVLQVGDSMSYSYAYGLWARNTNNGATAEDADTIAWIHANVNNDDNGWNWSSRGVTAMNNMGWWAGTIDDIYTDARLNDAQFAILMMNVPTSNPIDLSIVEQRVAEFIAVGIVPILSTIPPRTSATFDIERGNPYNTALRALAQQLSVPLIDYSKEILLRRPNGTWENTLIGNDGVHPSGGVNGYSPSSNPYLPGGDPDTHTTGDAALNSGYLLRTWLAVQKMQEIKALTISE